MATKVKTGVLGTLTELNFADNGKARFGAGNDLQIYHNGSNASIISDNNAASDLLIQSNNIVLEQVDGTNMIHCAAGAVQLYYSGSPKLATTSSGVTVTGSEVLFDNTGGDFTLKLNTNAVGDKNEIIMGDTGTPLAKFGVSGTANDIITGSDGQDFNIGTAGGGRAINFSTDNFASVEMKLDGGKLGIGTTSPQGLIDLTVSQAKTTTSGTTFAQLGKTNESSNYAAIQCEVKGGASAADRKWEFQTIEQGVANAGSIVFQPSGGNVGIGHTSPNSKLSIVGDGSSNTYSGTIGIENTASDKWASITLTDDIDATTASSNYYLIGRGSTYANRYMSFHVPTATNYGSGSQPKFVFASTGADILFTVEASTGNAYHKGNLLVGTTSTSTLATHSPNIISSTQIAAVSGSNIATFGVDRIYFNESNYYVLNASAVGVKLVNGATSWTTQSDESLKENVVELTGALEKVKDYRCVEYNLIADENKSKKIGFIAQDWQKDYDQVVSQDDDGTLGLQYTETIPVLLKAIQEQQAQIDELKAKLESK